jgi:hypothetical protein
MGLWGFKDREDAVIAKAIVNERRRLPAYREIGVPDELPDWAQDACLAVIATQLPARVGRVAGGPVDATFQRLNTATGAIANETGEGSTCQVWSWATVPSQNPADLPNGEHFIWICQDRNGIWWLCNEECFDV